MNNPQKEINSRIAAIREKVSGRRGKASFAKLLGISPSTYEYYEKDRTPPADILVRIADLGSIDLRWLITGKQHQDQKQTILTSNPILQRAAELMAKHPQSADALLAFLDILEQTARFPAKKSRQPASASQAIGTGWIPILGRSAAGVAHFWPGGKKPQCLTNLDDLINQCKDLARQTSPAAIGSELAGQSDPAGIIVLTDPPAGCPPEFLDCPGLKAKHPDAFALRIDGESMSPEIKHGDVVVVSPSVAAETAKPAVVQLHGQIGVTCKLFRRHTGQVHLVAVNEQFPPQNVPEDSVDWAFKVLARIRPINAR